MIRIKGFKKKKTKNLGKAFPGTPNSDTQRLVLKLNYSQPSKMSVDILILTN